MTKTLLYRMMGKHRILVAALVISGVLLLLSTNQISDKERMRKLLCAMHSDGHHLDDAEADELEREGNAFPPSIDKVNADIAELSAQHSGSFERRFPQAIVIGVRKCGTRALLEMLRMHPSIVAANPEIHFFDDNYSKGMQWYREQMPFSYADQITMEKTPAYFVTSEAPERISRMNSSIKLLAIVRDPTVRTISDYTQIKSHTSNKLRNFPRFEDKVLDHGEIDTSYQAIRTSMYANYVKSWQRHFSPSQLMFVDGAKLILDPLPEMKKVEQFLNLKSFFSKRNFVYNATKGFYCLKSTKLKCLGDKKGQSHPDVDPIVLKKLQKFFRPYNDRFFELIGQTFEW
ncbi:heparan sulfate glucosamine 3-O-sulfotransferase 5-like [Diadema setosum]|uniref:heparan sulfate glucosamine 3-O-sulfotransferase 5-like n=1 Tax=Diadema setosum TaxID=31175 RepID=UPI003B3A8830